VRKQITPCCLIDGMALFSHYNDSVVNLFFVTGLQVIALFDLYLDLFRLLFFRLGNFNLKDPVFKRGLDVVRVYG
jgi:hypothetical protein